MGGGTSIWASPEWRSDPKEIFNWKLFYLTSTVAFAGCAYGFDQGNIGGVLTLPSFRKAFGLDMLSQEDEDAREGNIAAMSEFCPQLGRVDLYIVNKGFFFNSGCGRIGWCPHRGALCRFSGEETIHDCFLLSIPRGGINARDRTPRCVLRRSFDRWTSNRWHVYACTSVCR